MIPIPDLIHRTFVYGLVGVCVWGVGTGLMVHRDTLRRGQEILEERKSAGLVDEVAPDTKKKEADEDRWARMAQSVWEQRGIGPRPSST